MSPEWVAIYITVIGGVGTGINIWISLKIKTDILELKLWAQARFVAKEDMTTYLSPIKDSIQMVGSARRLQDLDPPNQAPNFRHA